LYYKNSNACLAVYDISNRASFEALPELIANYKRFAPFEYENNIVLVGNKLDIGDVKREVKFEQAL
jgi:GTPase SAR1 family protein